MPGFIIIEYLYSNVYRCGIQPTCWSLIFGKSKNQKCYIANVEYIKFRFGLEYHEKWACEIILNK